EEANAGIFSMAGVATAGITIHFALPEYLELDAGGDRLMITFRTTDLAVDETQALPAAFAGSWDDRNPRVPPAGITLGAAGTTWAFIGGKVTPTIAQTAGAYTGEITLYVIYNGT
ncbi:MAG: hypothetical protein V3T31_05620, partial [candidate division Zixibacteria bacterium]